MDSCSKVWVGILGVILVSYPALRCSRKSPVETPTVTPAPVSSPTGGQPTTSATAQGSSEPAYCHPASFRNSELVVSSPGVQRAHAFRVGNVTLVGLAVGHSEVSGVKALAQEFSKADARVGYCTWYYNVRNPEAARSFNHFPVAANPTELTTQTGSELFVRIAGPNFDQGPVSFVDCAERFGYIALGCDAQKHRGPTVFSMLLAFSGCAPEHATEIANGLWGLNGVSPEVRLAIARAAFELGEKRSDSRRRLQVLLGHVPPAR